MFIVLRSYLRLCHFCHDQCFTAHTCFHYFRNSFQCFCFIHHQTVFFVCDHKFTIFSGNCTVFRFTVKFFRDLCQFCVHQFAVVCIRHFDIHAVFQQCFTNLFIFRFGTCTTCFISSFYRFFHLITGTDLHKRNFPFQFFRFFAFLCFTFVIQSQHLTADFCFIFVLQQFQCFCLAHACHICTINGHTLINTFCRQQFLYLFILHMIIAEETCRCHSRNRHYDHCFFAAFFSLRHSWSITQAFRPLKSSASFSAKVFISPFLLIFPQK